MFLSACADECENPIDERAYLIKSEALEFTKNYIGTTRVFFETSDNQEVSFEVSTLEQSFEYGLIEPCENNPSEEITIDVSAQSIDISLSNDSLFSQPFVIRLAEGNLSKPNENQIMVISYDFYNPIDNINTLLYYPFDGNRDNLNILESLDLNGKTFFSVIELNQNFNLSYDIKYTETEGIIYIKDSSTGVEYTYLRKE